MEGLFSRLWSSNHRWMRSSYSGIVIDVVNLQAQYFAIPKVACSSLMAALVDFVGVEFPDNEWKPELFQTNKWDHLYTRAEVVLTKETALRLAKRFRFAFVRNPWDRLVSCYAEKIRDDGDEENFTNGVSNVLRPFGVFHRGMSFEDFTSAAVGIADNLADPHWRSQFTFLVDGRGRMPMDFIGRFENLEDDVAQLSVRIGAELKLPHLLASKHEHYRDYYSRALREKVRERYLRDINMFGYAF